MPPTSSTTMSTAFDTGSSEDAVRLATSIPETPAANRETVTVVVVVDEVCINGSCESDFYKVRRTSSVEKGVVLT